MAQPVLETTEVQGEHRDLSNRELKGFTARLLWTIISSTVIVVGGGLKAYYDLIERQKVSDATKQVLIDNLQEQINDLKLKLNAHDVQFGKIDDRFYNLKNPRK